MIRFDGVNEPEIYFHAMTHQKMALFAAENLMNLFAFYCLHFTRAKTCQKHSFMKVATLKIEMSNAAKTRVLCENLTMKEMSKELATIVRLEKAKACQHFWMKVIFLTQSQCWKIYKKQLENF